MFRYGSLMGYYRDSFIMAKKYNISIAELESMMPWEKIVYVDMINAEEKAAQ